MTTTLQRRSVQRCGVCRGKLAFHSRGDAERFRARQQRDFGDTDGLTAYRCPLGNGFHLGHSRTKQPFVHRNYEPAR